jgi:uncharacterized SAM-binding protein YcdF (DUF218 family)
LKTSKYRPSRGHKWRWLLVLCALLLLAFVTAHFWLAALGSYLVRAESPVHADMIVVLAGDFSGNRILTAGDLVRRGFASKALISGPSGAYGLYESELAVSFAVRHGFPESYFIPLPNDARSTRDEAGDVLAALKQRHVQRIDIVTSDFHTRRAGNIFRARAADLEIHMVAAPDQYFSADGWWKNRDGRKTFLLEWMKTVATWFGL